LCMMIYRLCFSSSWYSNMGRYSFYKPISFNLLSIFLSNHLSRGIYAFTSGQRTKKSLLYPYSPFAYRHASRSEIVYLRKSSDDSVLMSVCNKDCAFLKFMGLLLYKISAFVSLLVYIFLQRRGIFTHCKLLVSVGLAATVFS